MDRDQALYAIENEKQQQTALAKQTSTSKVGVFTTLKFVFAVVAEHIYGIWAHMRAELEALVNTNRWATTAWYIEKAKAFQLGDALEELTTGRFGYPTVDQSKRVVAQAAIEVSDRTLYLKLAAEEGSKLVQFPDEYMPLFKAYINQIKRPGTPIRFINYAADQLTMSIRVFFDGELKEADVHAAVMDAIDDYLQHIVFNGVFSVTKLIDRIQQVSGVTGAVWVSGKTWASADDETGAVDFIDRAKAVGGYFALAEDDEGFKRVGLDMIRDN